MNEKAIAYVYGSAEYPRLQGRITFHQIQDGVLITAEVHWATCGTKLFRWSFRFPYSRR